MIELEGNIEKFDDLEINEKILFINNRQLKNIKKSSYFNIFNSILGLKKLLDQEKKSDKFECKKELDEFLSHWESAINSVILSMSEGFENYKKETIEELKETRKNIYSLFLVLEGYKIESLYIGEIIDEYGVRMLSERDYRNTSYEEKKIEELNKIINKVLDENKENCSKYIYIISEIISILPMRLVKGNYYNIIKNALMRNLKKYNKSEIEIQINEYKKNFDSTSRDGYATKFDCCFREIQKMKNFNLEEKTLEDLSKLVKQNTELNNNINKLININLILGLITNMNLVVALINEDSLRLEIKGIYSEWEKLLKNNNDAELKRFKIRIEKEISEVEKAIFKDLEIHEKLNMEALSREDFNYEKLNTELRDTKEILTYYNDSNFSNYNNMFPENKEKPNNEYLEQSIDSLIEYINRSIVNKSNFERRIRMRKMLSKIELPFSNVDDFSEYIKYALNDKIVKVEEINFKINHIYYFLKNL